MLEADTEAVALPERLAAIAIEDEQTRNASQQMPELSAGMFILQVKSGSAATSASAARSRSSRASAAVRPF